jgi:hypothetical protein
MPRGRHIAVLVTALLVTGCTLHAAGPLNGPWRFAAGDRPEYASLTFDDSAWQQVRVPHRFETTLGPNYTGIAWYRIRVTMPSTAAALAFNGLGHAAEVYVDGRLVHSYGKIGPRPEVIWPVPQFVPVPAQGPEALIAVRVLKVDYPIYGPIYAGLVRTAYFGPAATMRQQFQLLQARNYANYVLPAALGVIYLLLGILLIVLGKWSERPRYFAGLGLFLGGAGFDWTVGLLPAYQPQLHLEQLNVAFMFCGYATSLGFVLVISEWVRISRRWQAGIHVVLLLGFAMGISGVEYVTAILVFWQLAGGIAALIAFVATFRIPEARLTLAPLALLSLIGLFSNGFLDSFVPGVRLPVRYWQGISIGPHALYPHNICFGLAFLLALILGLKSALRVSKRNAEAESEMRSARAIQESLNRPIELNIPGLKIDVCALAAREVGGDFHQALTGRDGALWLLIGDVSGKGLQGALWASTVIGAFREVVHDSTGPADGMRRLNRATHGLPTGMFISALIARITPSGELTYANAGHILPYRNGQMLEGQSGLPLGVFAAADYRENHLTLTPGDRLIFLSDGLMEAKDPKGKLLGFETVAGWLSQGVSPAELVRRAAAFGQDDDMTAVEVRHVS